MKQTKLLTKTALISSVYVVLTILSNALGLNIGLIQIRLSECLLILPYFTDGSVLGITLGCFIANIVTGAQPYDVIFGTIASFIGIFVANLLVKRMPNSKELRWLLPLPNIISNTLIIPPILKYIYNLNQITSLIYVTVFIGEIISCFILGEILFNSLNKHKNNLF